MKCTRTSWSTAVPQLYAAAPIRHICNTDMRSFSSKHNSDHYGQSSTLVSPDHSTHFKSIRVLIPHVFPNRNLDFFKGGFGAVLHTMLLYSWPHPTLFSGFCIVVLRFICTFCIKAPSSLVHRSRLHTPSGMMFVCYHAVYLHISAWTDECGAFRYQEIKLMDEPDLSRSMIISMMS